MAAQSIVVALIVVACTAYAAWTLMPAVARRALATRVLKLSLPERLARPFRRALGPSSACGGCDSCGDTAEAPKVKPVIFHRRS
jgi:hypothetical protein